MDPSLPLAPAAAAVVIKASVLKSTLRTAEDARWTAAAVLNYCCCCFDIPMIQLAKTILLHSMTYVRLMYMLG
jgi:hypothetical protein